MPPAALLLSIVFAGLSLGTVTIVDARDFRSALRAEEAKRWVLGLLRRKRPRVVAKAAPRLPGRRVFLRLDPTGSHLAARRAALPDGRVTEIRYVFPACADDTPLHVLTRMKRSLNTLQLFYPDLFGDDMVNWELVAAAGCRNRRDAKRRFHGFVIGYWDPPSLASTRDATVLFEKIRAGKATPADVADPGSRRATVLEVLKRNQKWKKMLVVADLTGSMTPYIGQVLLWFRLNDGNGRAKRFVFFNDGDDKPTPAKQVGRTGGLYSAEAKSFDGVIDLAKQAVVNGRHNADMPENDLEAVLQGIEKCGSDCEEIVLIADNLSDMRDYELLTRVKRPVRIILCGASVAMNLQYLELARKTGGSVHTMEQDLVDLTKLSEGKSIKVGGHRYLIRKGRFVRLRDT